MGKGHSDLPPICETKYKLSMTNLHLLPHSPQVGEVGHTTDRCIMGPFLHSSLKGMLEEAGDIMVKYNSSDFLTNDTQLIFAPGNYSLDSEIVVENVHSFSMSVEPIFSSKAVIICDHNTRFKFRNISIVTVSGFDFVGCLESLVVSVDHFQLENSKFHGRAVVTGTVLTIYDSIATLNRIVFMSAIEVNFLDDVAFINSSEYCPTELSNRVTVVLSLARSDVVVTQSQFEGNNVGLGRVIDNYDSDITIFNTTFVNNSVKRYCCSYNCCFTGGIVYANNPHGSTAKLYDNKFV